MGMKVVQNSREFRVRVYNPYRSHRSPMYCGTGVQNSQKFQAGIIMVYRHPGIVARSHRTYRGSGYGYESRTELTEVPRIDSGTSVPNSCTRYRSSVCGRGEQNSQKFRLGYGRTELTEVPGITMVNTHVKVKPRIYWSDKYIYQVMHFEML